MAKNTRPHIIIAYGGAADNVEGWVKDISTLDKVYPAAVDLHLTEGQRCHQPVNLNITRHSRCSAGATRLQVNCDPSSGQIALDQKGIIGANHYVELPIPERGGVHRDLRHSARRRLRRRAPGKVERKNVNVLEEAAVSYADRSTDFSAG